MTAALIPVLTGLSGCSLSLPAGVTDQSREIASLYEVMFVVGVAIFLLVEGLIIYTVIRYRRKPGDDALPPQIHGNMVAEAVWTIVPLVLVTVLFFLSWQTLNVVEARSERPSLTIKVVAFQFQWQFDYPNGVSVFGTPDRPAEMVLPINETIRINLTSTDVIHAFYVPAFNYKKDAVPGRVNSFEFTVRDAGVYRGQCAELCGVGHYKMLLSVRAVSRAEFDAWMRTSAGPPASPPAPPAASPSAPAASASAGSAPPPSATGAPAADIVRIAADQIAFDQAELTVPAGRPFSLVFDNREPVPHNVAIYTDASAGQSLFVGEIFAGPGERTYAVPALAAGSYFYRCDVHPVQMTGTLVAQ